ncbi:MAG: GNAT family protein [Vicingaceae bacterium]
MKPEINFPDEFPVLETERLSLTAFTPNDVENFFNLRSDEDFMMYLGLHPLKKKSEARSRVHDIIHDFDTEKGLNWKIAMKGKEDLIGYVGFWKIDYRHARAEIGFGLDQDHQQNGYMTEAMTEVVNYGFGQFGVNSIKAEVDPRNEGSIQLLLNSGFKKEGHFRENYYFDGEFLDSEYYCMIRSDWEKLKEE